MMVTDIAAYLLFLSGSAVVCFALYALMLKTRNGQSGGQAVLQSAIALGMSAVLGLVGAKLLYFIFRFTYILRLGIGSYFFSLKADELSYYGGMAGVCFGVFLSAGILGRKPVQALNAFAFPGALLAAMARFAEYWLGSLGTGDYLDDPLPFPLAVSEVWNPDFPEYYLAIFMLEGIVYLRVALFAWQNREDRLCFVRTVFYLCLSQIICESMRAQSIRWLFVRYEQLLCYLVCEGILIAYAVRGKKQHSGNWQATVFGLVVCGLTVLEEFMLDGKISVGEYGLPPVVIYGCMAWGLLELAACEHKARRRLKL